MLVSSYLILPLCGLLPSSSFPFSPSSSLSPPPSLLRVQLTSLYTLSNCPTIECLYQIFADCFKFHYRNYLLSLLCFTLHWPHFFKIHLHVTSIPFSSILKSSFLSSQRAASKLRTALLSRTFEFLQTPHLSFLCLATMMPPLQPSPCQYNFSP